MGNLAFGFHGSNGHSLQAFEFLEGHAASWIVYVVEPCHVYLNVHIGLLLQEILNYVAAPQAGAIGQVPGHVTDIVASWLKDFLQEVPFCMAFLVISDPVLPRPGTLTPLQLAQEVCLPWMLPGIKVFS